MWKLLRIIFVIKVHFIYGKLVGDHICYTEESYLANVTENYPRNITVRHYQWCYNVPPRCSYYTIKEINDSRIVEKNQTRIIETCCAGFIEKDERCIRNCTKCRHGDCDNGSCLCPPGFKGHSCDVACDFGEWGLNCSKRCDCGDAACNPKTGLCSEGEKENKLEKIVQATLATNETPFTLSTIPLNQFETQSIHSYVDLNSEDNDKNRTVSEDVNPAKSSLKELEVSTGYREVANTHPTPIRSFGTEKKYGDIRLVTDNSANSVTNSIDVLKDVERSNHPYNSNLTTNLNNNIAGTKQTETETVLETPLEQFKSSTESANTNTSRYNDSNEGFLIPVGIKYDQQQNSQPKNIVVTTTSYGHSEDYMLVPREGFTKQHAPSDDVVSIHSLTIVVISVFIVIILVVAVMIVSYTRSNRRKERLQKEEGTAAVSFIATSIFHKPLPDPPTTENPTYLTPVAYHRAITDAPTFETSIFCNFNAPNRPKSDCREYLYDHPPSTGSYRAASSIDPLDINRASISEEAVEPLYDEIRYTEDTDQTYEGAYQYPKPLSIYINTFGKTKF